MLMSFATSVVVAPFVDCVGGVGDVDDDDDDDAGRASAEALVG